MLLKAAAEGKVLAVESLLHDRSKIDVETLDDSNRTPFIHASISGYATITALLLQAGANANHMDVYGRTALHYGSLKNHVPVVQALLLSNYTKLEIQDNNGDSPVDLAMISNSGATVALLPFYGAKLNSEAKQKLFSLMWICSSPGDTL